MSPLLRSTLLALAAATALPALAQDKPSAPSGGSCTLSYQRADNMWAAAGRPDGALGTETLTLQPGQKKVFSTDWKYEKQRNDGTNYYGSHLRVATNTGTRSVHLVLRGSPLDLVRGAFSAIATKVSGASGATALAPGGRATYKHDLMEVVCP